MVVAMVKPLIVAGVLTFAGSALCASTDVMLILDASNSMWGRVDGEPKIVVARRAVVDLAATLPPDTRIGLMTYGHRRAGDCGDIETIVPVGTVDPTAIKNKVDVLKPRGRTPLSEAVRRAAEELAYTDRPARVILVSDGIETCNADPCALASELKGTGVDFVAHVIGFDVVDQQDQQQLRCLAEGTGGRFVTALDARSLAEALAAVTGAEVPAEAVPADAQPTASAMTNLTLEAVDVEHGQILSRMLWQLESTDDSPRALVRNDGSPRPSISVPSGRYRVTAQTGNARVIESFEATGGDQLHRVVMNVGRLRTSAALAEGTPDGIGGGWYLDADEVPGYRTGESVVSNNGHPKPEFILVQGSYRVRFRSDAASGSTDVFVTAAETTTLRIDMGAALVTLRALKQGTPVQGGVLWEVYARDGTERRIDSSGASSPRFTLPAGRYEARVSHLRTWHHAPFEVAPGETKTIDIAIQ